MSEFTSQSSFIHEIIIAPEIREGEHRITVVSPGINRYAPAHTDIPLLVTRTTPLLDLDTPNLAFIPGTVRIKGVLYSEDSPLSGATIKMKMGNSQVDTTSSADGAFDAKLKIGMGFGFLGTQVLKVEVIPRESWYRGLYTESNLVVLNLINASGLIAIIAFPIIYLTVRLRRRQVYLIQGIESIPEALSPETVQTYGEAASAALSIEERGKDIAEPRTLILNAYRLVIRFIEGITSSLIGPHQTLREFAVKSSAILGITAHNLVQLTKIVERILYSAYMPTKADITTSQNLSRAVETEAKHAITVSSTSSQPDYEHSDEKALVVNPWQQLSTWLWVVLIVTVAYYACLLLFMLPLLFSSPASTYHW